MLYNALITDNLYFKKEKKQIFLKQDPTRTMEIIKILEKHLNCE